jgi:hypothetical protein
LEDEMGGACRMQGRYEKFIQNFGLKPEGKWPFGKPGRRWEENNRMDPWEIEWESVD